jgi:hypothetical protein
MIKTLTTLTLLLISYLSSGQSITINTAEGRKTLHADKSKACNKNLVFMTSAESPTFDNTKGELDDRLNSLTNFDKKIKGQVIIWFTINCKGEAFGFQIIEGLDETINKKIIDSLTQIQDWKPGRQSGKPVDSVYNLKLAIKKGKISI